MVPSTNATLGGVEAHAAYKLRRPVPPSLVFLRSHALYSTTIAAAAPSPAGLLAGEQGPMVWPRPNENLFFFGRPAGISPNERWLILAFDWAEAVVAM